MINEKRILAVVPARGGSKGIPLKNIRLLQGKPLIAHTAEVISAIPMIDRAVVSTDHDEIAKVSEKYGLYAPFRRPADLSGDYVGDLAVLQHALEIMETIDNTQYDIILMLQPTSPLRKAEHVVQAVQMLVTDGWDAVWTISETNLKYHPDKQLTINDKCINHFSERGKLIVARQQLKPVYHRNGIAYAFTRECLLEQNTTMGIRTAGLVLSGKFSNIDSEYDLLEAERLMGK